MTDKSHTAAVSKHQATTIAAPPISHEPHARAENPAGTRLKRAVSIAQISTPIVALSGVLLAAWGYVHTVLPVIQFQRLKEQATQLEMDNARASEKLRQATRELQQTRAELAQAHRQQDEVAAETRKLNESLARAQTETRRLTLRAESAKSNERLALKRAEETTSVLQQQQAELEKKRWEIVANSVYSSLGTAMLNQTIESVNSSDKTAFILEEAKRWPKPYEAVIAAINAASIKRRADIPVSYFQELRDAVDEQRSRWQCETPDFQKWQSDYSSELSALVPGIERELEDYIAEVRKQKSSPDSTVLITDEFRAAARRSFKTSAEYKVRTKYQDKLHAMRKVCDDVSFTGLAAIFSAKQAAVATSSNETGSGIPSK